MQTHTTHTAVQYRKAVWIATAGVVMFTACTERQVLEPTDLGTAIAPGRLESVAGIAMSENDMRDALSRITRSVAVALADEHMSSSVYEAIHRSPYREGKLHFRSFLNGDGVRLVARIAEIRSVQPDQVFAGLDSVLDLEFYMPVPAHRAMWKGGTDLLVASSLQDDGRPPIAYDVTGKQVVLSSAEAPPSTPTLALVPVETDFSSVPRSAAESPLSEQPGVYMVYSNILDDHEGFLHGQPEFELHSFVQNSAGTFVDLQCAGAERSGALEYDQNDQIWTGRVLGILESAIDGDSVQFQVWEDDTGPCTDTGGRPPKTDATTKSQIANYAARFIGVIIQGNKVLKAAQGAALAIDLSTVSQKDDFVGFIGLEGPSQGCWNSTGPSSFHITDASGGSEGTAALDWTFGERDPVCQTAEPLPYGSVRIWGPTQVRPNSLCYYYSTVTEGTSPYSYQWFNNSSPIGTSSDINYGYYSDYDLILVVHDANERAGLETLHITVSESAPICMQ